MTNSDKEASQLAAARRLVEDARKKWDQDDQIGAIAAYGAAFELYDRGPLKGRRDLELERTLAEIGSHEANMGFCPMEVYDRALTLVAEQKNSEDQYWRDVRCSLNLLDLRMT